MYAGVLIRFLESKIRSSGTYQKEIEKAGDEIPVKSHRLFRFTIPRILFSCFMRKKTFFKCCNIQYIHNVFFGQKVTKYFQITKKIIV